MDTKISYGSYFVLERLKENKEEAYLVGGCVRDFLMGRKPSDFDVTTSAKPNRIEEIFSDQRLITLGKNYGTVGIFVKGELVEVTSFRADGQYVDGRHPSSIQFSKSLEEDLKRRDFTINSMAMDLDGKLVDIFSGQEDIKNKVIRTVGNAEKRFEEDKLRMLRAVRFANRFSFTIEKNTFSAIRKMASQIKQVSNERIQQEINKILLSDDPARGIELMLETGLLKEIFPELISTVDYNQINPYHNKTLFKHLLCVLNKVPKKLHLRLAALFHDIGKPKTLVIDENGVGHFYGHDQLGAKMVVEILRRLKYDNKTINKVSLLVDRHMKADPEMGDKGLKGLINKVGEDLIIDLMDLIIADRLCTRDDRDIDFLLERKSRVEYLLEKKVAFNKSGLKISGRDLLDIGYKEGKIIGNILDQLTEMVLEDEELNTKERLLEIAKDKLKEN